MANGRPLPRLYLKPGNLFIADNPTMLATTLGSCVAVCLFNPQSRIGAMCHGMRPKHGHSPNFNECARFIDCSVNFMINELLYKKRIPTNRLQAKIFGGAKVIDLSKAFQAGAQIGEYNIRAARAILKEHTIPIVHEDVGGNQTYKLFFHTGSGSTSLEKF